MQRNAARIGLVFYWPVIFALTHSPRVVEWVRPAGVSDKTAHFVVYLVLGMLLWYAAAGYEKARPGAGAFWCAAAVLVGYSGLDEWLQGFVGRTVALADFVANVAGVAGAMFVVSIFRLRAALVVATAVVIFALSNLCRVDLGAVYPVTFAGLHAAAYGFFAVVLYWWLNERSAPDKSEERLKLWAVAILPIVLLAAVKLFSVMLGRTFSVWDVAAGVAGAAVVTLWFYVGGRLRETEAGSATKAGGG